LKENILLGGINELRVQTCC